MVCCYWLGLHLDLVAVGAVGVEVGCVVAVAIVVVAAAGLIVVTVAELAGLGWRSAGRLLELKGC